MTEKKTKKWTVSARPPKGRDGKSWQLIYRPPPGQGRPGKLGKPYQVSAKTEDPARAKELALQEQRRLNGGRPSLAWVIERYLADNPQLRESTRRRYRTTAKTLGPVIDGLEELRPALLLIERDELQEHSKASTINADFGRAETSWAHCANRELTNGVEWPTLRGLRVEPDNRRALSQVEVWDLARAFAAYRGGAFLPLVAFLLGTGCRTGEAVTLLEGDLDRAAGVARIRPENSKTRAGRVVAIPAAVWPLLAERDDPAAHVFQVPLRGKGPLVPIGEPAQHGGRKGLASFAHAWRQVTEELGWGRLHSPHALRRTWIRAARQGAGVELEVSMGQVGHQSVKQHQHYQRGAPPAQLGAAAEAVASELGLGAALGSPEEGLRLIDGEGGASGARQTA